ncbi:MAG: hypothetical protein WBX19_12860 [Terracidiphilus sp.]
MDVDDPSWKATRPAGLQDGKKRPPVPVFLVALFQFLKAGFLLFLLLKLWGFGAALNDPDKTLFGEVIMGGATAILIGGAVYFSLSALGLLRLERSARRKLMWNILAGWLVFGMSFSGIFFGEGPFIGTWQTRTLICAFLLDSFLYCCLAFYPDVAKAFGDKDETDFLP